MRLKYEHTDFSGDHGADRKARVNEWIALLKEADIAIQQEKIPGIVLLSGYRILDPETDREGDA